MINIIFFTLYKEQVKLNVLLAEAQDGNVSARDEFIGANHLFIKKVVGKKIGGCPDIENRDEYSIGLMAFNEAIDSFKPGLRSFHSFAGTLINNRLVDYYRSQKKHAAWNIAYVQDFQEDAPNFGQSYELSENIDIKFEMDLFLKMLSEYHITLTDLMDETPKHTDSRILCLRIARIITEHDELYNHLQKYKTIPLKALLSKIKLNKKTVERHRKYIVAICLILLSNLETMRDYIMGLVKGCDER